MLTSEERRDIVEKHGEGILREVEERMESRACGPCYACCVHLGIEALGKRAGVPCRHLDGRNGPERRCSVYGTERIPKACPEYLCAWRIGGMSDEMRPDNSGLLMSLYPRENGGMSATVTVFDTGKAGVDISAGPLAEAASWFLKAQPDGWMAIVFRQTGKVLEFRDGEVWLCRLRRSKGVHGLDYERVERVAGYVAGELADIPPEVVARGVQL